MSEDKRLTVAEAQLRKSKNRLITTLVVIAVIITFMLGYGVGHFGNSGTSARSVNDSFSTFESVYNILTEKFYYGENTDTYQKKIMNEAIKGMVDAQGDIHTEYMTSDELASFTGSLESSFVGIGVRYTMLNGNIFVIEVLEDSPAERHGIKAGDFITAIDGVKCTDLNPDEIPSRITGEKQTSVNLEVLRETEVLKIDVIRDEIQTTVTSRVEDNIGIVSISSFSTGTAEELKKHLDKLHDQNVSRLIIDLRDNGGGYASTLDSMCAFFMEDGAIVMIEEDRNGKEIIDKVRRSQKFDYNKIVVLVDEDSASCSEVFTLALKENCDAVVVGETTYGKGIAQVTKVFADGSALKYTDVIWKSGKGVSIHGVGITPDYVVRLHDAFYKSYITLEEDELYKYDEVNEKVATAQLILDFLGYGVDRTDGYFSQATQSSMLKFQQDNSLEVTGTLNRETANALSSTMIYEWNMNRKMHDVQMQKAMEIVKQ